MKFFTQIKTLALVAGMMMTSNAVMAGDGTKATPYTVAELNAQKEALAASGDTVWVKADLKGLGEDGSLTENTDNNCAGLFVDGTDESNSFVAYSYQILAQLAISDLTNTKDLLIALTYGTTAHPYGNTNYPQYASNYEPETAHFSLVEVHNALSLTIPNGLRGYHIASSYIIPKDIIAVKVSAGYSASKGAYVNYTNFDGAKGVYATPKNSGFVLMAMGGDKKYDFVLTTDYYDQTMSNSNALNPGTQAGVNAGTAKNRVRLRFVNDGTKVGFERNSEENCTVTLESKDEVFLQISSLETNFYGNWAWETDAKDWITWKGGSYADFKTVFDFKNNNMGLAYGYTEGKDQTHLHDGDLDGVVKTIGDVTISFTAGNTPGSRYFYNTSKGYHFNPSKNSTFTLKAAEGKAIKGVNIIFQTSANGLTVNNGTYEAGTWTGNAEAVTFTASGARYIYYIVVTVDEKDEQTVTGVKEIEAANNVIKKRTSATGVIYDLNGNRVNLMQKGRVYIVDGKKIVK